MRVEAFVTEEKIKGTIISLPRYITSNRNPSECEIYRDLGSCDIRRYIGRKAGYISAGVLLESNVSNRDVNPLNKFPSKAFEPHLRRLGELTSDQRNTYVP